MKKLIFPVLILFFLITSAYAQEVGKITALQGKVDLLRDGKPPAIEAKINLPIYLKDIIRTKTDSKAEITFKDGTVLRIAPKSRVDISEYISDGETVKATINLPRGKVAAYVSEPAVKKIKDSPSANKFEVKTPIAVAGVRGTNYLVAHYPTYSTVLVLKGQVYCYNVQFPKDVVTLNPGQMTVIREKMIPAPPASTTPPQIQREERDVIIGTGPPVSPKAESPVAFAIAPSPAYFPPPPTENQVPVSNLTNVEAPLINVNQPLTENTQVAENITPPPPPEPPPPPPGGGGGTQPPTSLTINVDLVSVEPGSVNLYFGVTGEREIKVKYRVNGDSWIDVNTEAQQYVYFPITVTHDDSYIIDIQATDLYGNSQTWTSEELKPQLGILSGKIYSTATGDVSGAVASVIGKDKGVAKLNVSGSVPVGDFQSAGGDLSYGFFVYYGTYSSGGNFNTTFKLLTPNYLFSGSGPSLANLSDYEEILSLTTSPLISVKPLTFSTEFDSMFHEYFNGKIEEVSGTWAKFLFGRTESIQFPTNVGDEINLSDGYNHLVGLENSAGSYHVFWGTWNADSTTLGKVKGYGAGFVKDNALSSAHLYGLYIDPDGNAGFAKVISGAFNYLSNVGGFISTPELRFIKKAEGYSDITNTWGDFIEGIYSGYFTGGSGTPDITQKNIFDTSQGFIASRTLSLTKGTSPDLIIEPWGVFGIEIGGSHSATNPTGFHIEFAGNNWDNRDADPDTPDYWIGYTNTTEISNGKMSGDFTGRFMTPTHYGIIASGSIYGQFNDSDWVGVIIGEYSPLLELKHRSNLDDTKTKFYENDFSSVFDSGIFAYLGGDEFWSLSAPRMYSVGDLYLDLTSGKGYVYYGKLENDTTSFPDINYSGYMGGWIAGDQNYNMNAILSGIYSDPSNNKGLFIVRLSDDGTCNVLKYSNGFWLESDTDSIKKVVLGTGYIFPPNVIGLDTAYFSIYDSYPQNISLSNKNISFTFENSRNFGAGFIGTGGSYLTPPPLNETWYIAYNYQKPYDESDPTTKFHLDVVTQNNNPWADFKIRAKTYGYYADLNPTTPVTGIFVGETVGTFNPTGTKWQTVTVGTFVETNTYLSNLGSLGNINIPVVEVGSVDLSYSNPSCNDCIRNVSMSNVKFFASQTGQAPTLWATNSVSGTFDGTVPLNNPVTLQDSGNVFSVNFTPTVWDTTTYYKWAATISGSGSIGGYSIQMKGVGAGGISGTNFSGTAAGYCK